MSFSLNQFNRRNAVSLVLAILLLTTAATPALAWFDEGEVAGQASLPCRVIEDGAGGGRWAPVRRKRPGRRRFCIPNHWPPGSPEYGRR